MFEQLKIDEAADRAAKLAKDGLHFTVGLASTAAKEAKEQWVTYTRRLEASWDSSKDQLATFTATFEPTFKAIDERLSSVESCVGEYVEQSSKNLPEGVAKAVTAAHEASTAARARLFEALAPQAPKADKTPEAESAAA